LIFESVKDRNTEEIFRTFNGIGESWSSKEEFHPEERYIDWFGDSLKVGEDPRHSHVRHEADMEIKYGGMKNWKILCRIWIGDYYVTTSSKSNAGMPFSGAQSRHLPIALFNFFQSGEHSDVEILGTGERIRAHKMILQGMCKSIQELIAHQQRGVSTRTTLFL